MDKRSDPVVFCRGCFIRGMDEDVFMAQLHEFISDLPPEMRADEAEYSRRLNICLDCDRLRMGMCSLCGMYVEMRAAVKKNICAKVHPEW